MCAAEVAVDARRVDMLAGLQRRIDSARLASAARLAWLDGLATGPGETDVRRLPALMLQVSSTDAN